MKKFLLLSISVCAALTISAQVRKAASIDGLKMQKATVSMQGLSRSSEYANATVKAINEQARPSKKAMAKLPEASDIYGMYVLDSTDEGDGATSFTQSANVTLTECNEVDPETGEVYNVLVTGLFSSFFDSYFAVTAEVLGQYDAEAHTLSIPFQGCYEDAQYGLFCICGISEASEEGYMLSDSFTLQIEEDENGFYFVPAEGCVGAAVTVGEGQEMGLAAVCCNDVLMNPANYIVQNEYQHYMRQGGSWEKKDEYGVFLEAIDEESIFIHGFMGLGTVEAKFDIDGNGTIETYQPLTFTNTQDNGWIYLGPCAWTPSPDGGISVDNEREVIYCGFYTFTMNSTGEQVEAFALYNPETEGTYEDGKPYKGDFEYYSLGMKGGSGGYPPLTYNTFMVENPQFAGNGIKDVTITPSKKSIFDLAGKRANKNANGLLIENGKKVIR